MNFEEKIKELPTSPGIYLMKDASGDIIYIGKARNLRERVRSYFRTSGDGRYHVSFLLQKLYDIEVILTDTEKEALLLENELIKRHQPRYNLMLKDDKTYFSVRIDLKEKFPRFTIVRKRPDDGARYFGPYSSSTGAKAVLRQIERIFPLRHYPLKTCMSRQRPCLYHQIGQCSAPCHGFISETDYLALASSALMFLDGKTKELQRVFREKMSEAADGMNYEEAARWRDLLRSLEITVEKQKVVTTVGNADVISCSSGEHLLEIALIFIRNGVISGSRAFSFNWEFNDAEGIASFINRYYPESDNLPDDIFLPFDCGDQSPLVELLKERKGKTVNITVPRRGIKRELVELAVKNSDQALAGKIAKLKSSEVAISELEKELHLSRSPKKMECYDISNMQGSYSVGSGVCFIDGKPEKKLYRRYKIVSVEGQDDFAMMKEVFSRRFAPEKGGVEEYPDLVVVDGGIGQLNAAVAIINELGLAGRFNTVSLAKSRVSDTEYAESVTRSDERVFLPGRRNPVHLKQNSKGLLLLAQIRDEAHRFAVSYHKKLRSKNTFVSLLESIQGVSEKRRTSLLKHFGSVENLRNATIDDIEKVAGFSRNLAERVFNFFSSSETSEE